MTILYPNLYLYILYIRIYIYMPQWSGNDILCVYHWHPLCTPAHVIATISSLLQHSRSSTSSAISNRRLNTHTATQLTPERPTPSLCACVCACVVSCFMRISSIATVNALKRRGTAGRDHCLCSLRMRGEIKERGREGEWGIGARERERENKSERAWARSLWSSKIVTFAWTNSFLPWRPCQYGIVLIKTQLHLKLDELLIGLHAKK